ncbi:MULTISPECIES: alpha/beta fold hydrolase [unclassified Sinorhizobium]|uniref:alpha/beta fold hydrolase n=1 Tax=unclassified Sinorhizobium TaxID=2613772 RepID=UPI003523E21F
MTADHITARDGARLAFNRAGPRGADVPRIGLIHSLALDASVWDDVIAELAVEADLVAIDCRGHGRSSRSAVPYTIEMFGDDIADIFDHLGWDNAIVAGCSMGGCVAQAFAARHPDRVRGLLLIDTTAWYGQDAPAEWRKRAERAKAEGLASMAEFQVTRWFGDRFRREHPARVMDAMNVFAANNIECYAATCEMLGKVDLRSSLAEFLFPVAIVVGEEDYATPVQAARDLQAAIPDASLTILPAARHLTPIECPKAIAGEIRTLIERAGSHGKPESRMISGRIDPKSESASKSKS